MSVSLYDKAFIDKLNNWTRNTAVTLVGPNQVKRLFEVKADERNDKPIQLPLIALSRRGGYNILDKTKRVLSFDGASVKLGTQRKGQLNAIPISIPYQLDIYTRYFEEADELSRNLVFNIINYPKLDIIIPYEDAKYHHEANIRMDATIEDTSDVPERLVPGQFTRNTLLLDIDDAYLFDIRYRDLLTLETTKVDSEE